MVNKIKHIFLVLVLPTKSVFNTFSARATFFVVRVLTAKATNRGRKSSTIHLPVAHKNQHHYIDIIPEGRRRKCAVCTDRNNTFRKSRISTWCSTCVVGLCVGDCFRKLHAGQEEWATFKIHLLCKSIVKTLHYF